MTEWFTQLDGGPFPSAVREGQSLQSGSQQTGQRRVQGDYLVLAGKNRDLISQFLCVPFGLIG